MPREPDGFREFVETRSAALVRSSWWLTGGQAQAEDLVQATFARCWPRWDDVMGKDSPEAYVRRVMMSIFLSWRRRRSGSEVVLAEPPDVVGFDDHTAQTDLRADVRRAISSLSAGQRAVVVLRYFDDLSIPETAAALGCSVGTVKSQTARALAALRVHPDVRDLIGAKEQIP